MSEFNLDSVIERLMAVKEVRPRHSAPSLVLLPRAAAASAAVLLLQLQLSTRRTPARGAPVDGGSHR